MSKTKIYYARAIDDRDDKNVWAEDKKIEQLITESGCKFVNPYTGNNIENYLEIANNDIELLKQCDILLADLSIPAYQYVGVIFEIAFASIFNIPVIIIVGNNKWENRVFFQAYCEFIARTWEEALEYISRVHTKDGIKKQLLEMQRYYHEMALSPPKKNVKASTDDNKSQQQHSIEREKLRQVIRKYVSGNVCQFGIGAGDWTYTICETAEKVVGIEISSELLKQAKINLSQFTNITYLHADILNNTLNPGAFDCIVIYFLLSILPPSVQHKLIGQIRRLLKPSGLLVIADTKKPENLPAMGLGRRILQKRNSGMSHCILYKEHFAGKSLEYLIEKHNLKIIDSDNDQTKFSWIVATSN